MGGARVFEAAARPAIKRRGKAPQTLHDDQIGLWGRVIAASAVAGVIIGVLFDAGVNEKLIGIIWILAGMMITKTVREKLETLGFIVCGGVIILAAVATIRLLRVFLER